MKNTRKEKAPKQTGQRSKDHESHYREDANAQLHDIVDVQRTRVCISTFVGLISDSAPSLSPFSMASISLLLTLFVFSVIGTSLAESRKELRNKQEITLQTLKHTFHYSNRINPSRVVQISWQPRVFLYKGFLSDKECEYLISLAYALKEESLADGGPSEGLGASLDMKDGILARIDERLSAWTFLPKENSKPLQVMHYEPEQNGQNLDYFTNKTNLELSGTLMATVVLYLSTATQGGQILFPESVPKSSRLSNCNNSSQILQPVKGNAILFFSLYPSSSPDQSSFHARCPVLEGDMWSATKYFYAKPINKGKVSVISDGGECTDEDDSCAAWAATGECQRNPVFMIGSLDYFGTCRKSCNAC